MNDITRVDKNDIVTGGIAFFATTRYTTKFYIIKCNIIRGRARYLESTNNVDSSNVWNWSGVWSWSVE